MEYYRKDESAQSVPLTTGAPKTETQPLPQQVTATVAAKKIFAPTGIDIVFALVTFLCGYLYIRLAFFKDVGLGILLFTLAFSATALAYTYYIKKQIPKYTWWYFAYVMALAVCSILLENGGGLSFYVKAALMVSAVYWVLALTCARRKGLDENLPIDLLNGFVIFPFSGFGKAFACLGATLKRSKNKNTLYILCGIVIAIPLLIWVISLLIAADAAFDYVMHNLIGWLDFNFSTEIGYFLFSVPVSCYLFGLFYNAIYGGNKKATMPQEKNTAATDVLFTTVLSLFAVVYTVFFGVQVAVLSGLEFAPAYTVSYAQYAREGFFQLCQVSVINFILFFVTRWFCNSKNKAVKGLLTVLGVQTLLLIGTAAAKMLLYINHHGFTIRRVFTSWFMAVLFVCVLLFIIGLWKRFNYMGASVMTAALAFLVLCYSNTGALVAHGNIAMWQKGYLTSLDVDSFYTTGTAAVPAAIALYPTVEDKDLQYELKYFISRVAGYGTEGNALEKPVQYFYNIKLAQAFLEQ